MDPAQPTSPLLMPIGAVSGACVYAIISAVARTFPHFPAALRSPPMVGIILLALSVFIARNPLSDPWVGISQAIPTGLLSGLALVTALRSLDAPDTLRTRVALGLAVPLLLMSQVYGIRALRAHPESTATWCAGVILSALGITAGMHAKSKINRGR